jgi:glycosyltransferase involved in cell wall biosynthesis
MASEVKRHKRPVLLICDEWFPTTGGISQFNRDLTIAFAAAGFRTLALVRTATAEERQDAKEHGVELFTATRAPLDPIEHLPVAEVVAARPGIVIGHDDVSGSSAWTWVHHHLRGAKLVYVLHTAHAHNECYKRPNDASRRIERRENLIRRVAGDAGVFAAVGPRLARHAEAIIGDGFGTAPVLRLDPGLTVADARRRRIPVNPTVMMLTRTAYVAPKGLDIAARAVAGLAGDPKPDLLIRGAAPRTCDELRLRLIEESGLAPDRVDVREFTSDRAVLARDLNRAVLCLMPSRVEGFGLSGLTAIAHGTPLLVSAKSGLAETLREKVPELARSMIVDVTEDEADVPRWRDATQRVLGDLPGAFERAHEVRARLAGLLRWDQVVQQIIAAANRP